MTDETPKPSGWCRAVDWVTRSLTEKGEPSSARLLTYYCYLMGSVWVINFMVSHHGDLPSLGQFTGLTTFCSSPYGLRAFASAIADRNNG